MNRYTLALLAASFPLLGADEPLPSVETVMDHLIDATGGRPAWEARHNLVEHATLDFAKQGLKGSLTIYEAAPNKYLGLTELPGIGKIAAGSNGEVAWENSALQGPRIKQGAERADAIREGAFNASLYWQKLYAKGETAGSKLSRATIATKLCSPPKKASRSWSSTTRSPGCWSKPWPRSPPRWAMSTPKSFTTTYRKDGDRLSPHRMVNRAAQQEFVIQIESVEMNLDLPKDRFDLPPEIQGLAEQARPQLTPRGSRQSSQLYEDARSRQALHLHGGNPVATRNLHPEKSATAAGIEIDGSGSASLGTMKIDIETV